MDQEVLEGNGSQVTESVDRDNLKIDDGTGSDKVDSGMDEDSQHSNENQDDHEESDNEDIVIRKTSKKRAVLLDDDDDESSRDSTGSNASDNGPQMDEDQESQPDKESDDNDKESLNENDKDIGNESDSSTSPKQGTSSGGLFTNTDLFDAESDSDKGDNSDDDKNSGDESGSDSNNDEADDEGFEESSIDPKLLKKLKKGAAKKEPRKSKRQAKKEELLQIHAETQRIVRESSVRLPYHQPAPKSLNDFLARANKKQQEYKALKGGVRDLQKAKALQDILTRTKIASSTDGSSQTCVRQDTDKSNITDNVVQTDAKHSNVESGIEIDSANVNDNVEKQTSEEKINQRLNSQSTMDCDFDDNDSLPDLHIETESDKTENTILPGDTSNIDSTQSNNDQQSMLTDENSLTQNEGENMDSELLKSNKSLTVDNDNMNIESSTKIRNNSQNENIDNDKCSDKSDQQENDIVLTSVNQSKHLTPILKDLPQLSTAPRLSGGPDSFIDLDVEENVTPKNPGLTRFMDRLVKHSQTKKKKHVKDVDISIVQKEKVETEKEELKMNTFTYHAEEDEENPLAKLETPGAKLQALKVQLKEKMKERREEARQRRQEIFDLDNEEVEGENPVEALDEEELTDGSDTDVEDDEFDEQFGDEEYEEEEKKVNPFVDEEASSEDEDYVPGADNSDDDDDETSLRLHLSDEDDDDENEVKDDNEEKTNDDDEEVVKDRRLSSGKKKPKRLQISDDEDSLMEPTAVEGTFKEPESKEVEHPDNEQNNEISQDDHFSPFSKHLSATYQTQNKSKRSSLSLPIEDSMDLYGNTQDIPSTIAEPTQSQSLNFFLEDSQSQMLDADGFLKVGSAVKPPRKISAIAQLDNSNTHDNMDDFFGLCSGKFTKDGSASKDKKITSAFGNLENSNTQDNMDELLGLCSGRFAATQSGKEQSCNKSLFTLNKEVSEKSEGFFGLGKPNDTQKNMDEFMGLCSGTFSLVKTKETDKKSGVKRKSPLDDDEESNDTFTLVSEGEDNAQSDKDELSDDDGLSNGGDIDEVDGDVEMRPSDDEEMEFRKQEKFKGFTVKNKHGKIRREFVEDEAELSGSEYDSDENYDIAEHEDILEMEEGDKDVQIPESELRDQVGRVHLKQLIDEDKRELLRFQEMYLPDGDLHSEGGGRTRKFKWKDIDDDTQQDMFNDSDGEKEEEEGENDFAWRKERFEREKWLQENQENEKLDDDSQFLKLGKVFFKRRDSDTSQNVSITKPKPTTEKKESPATPNTLLKLTKQKRGSFLTRDKQTLAKIAETTKSNLKINGAKNSKNLVFQVISPDKETQAESQAMPAPVERKARKALQPKQAPAAKKRRVDTDENTMSQNSIFNHI